MRRSLASLGLLFAGASAMAFVPVGVDWTWQSSPIEEPFQLNVDSFPASANRSDVELRLNEAAEIWNQQGGANVVVRTGGTTNQQSWNPADFQHVVQWRATAPDPATLALSQLWVDGDDIVDCDIRFYGENDFGPIEWSADVVGAGPGQYDLGYTAVHEFGHCLGLDHSDIDAAVMAAEADTGLGLSDRNLHPDDIAGIQSLYGAAQAEIVLEDVVVSDVIGGDGDGIAEPGEQLQLQLIIRNDGTAFASSPVGVVTTANPFLLMVQDMTSFADVAPTESESGSPRVEIVVDPSCDDDREAVLDVDFVDELGMAWFAQFELFLSCGTDPVDDADGDGFPADDDCDDNDASIFPGATEFCDGIDTDCDGEIDEPQAIDADAWYVDADADGFGDPDRVAKACEHPTGWVSSGTDCNDADPDIYPGAPDRCNGLDNDCDGTVDSGLDELYFFDGDDDGYGSPIDIYFGCDPPDGYIADDTDCDDSSPDRFPGNPEVCDGIDNDCDLDVDEDLNEIRFRDADGDGFGDPDDATSDCNQPTGYVADGSDCDDGDGNVFPGATEVCDGIDNDCDGVLDDGDLAEFYRDADADGFGDDSDTVMDCVAPTGFGPTAGDCDDANAAIYPGAPELCDGLDNDCNPATADGTNLRWHNDGDGDGFGDPFDRVTACDAPSGYVLEGTDCNDDDAAVYPGADELCDGLDNDCDAVADEGLDNGPWYFDADLDGFGDASTATTGCAQPPGTSDRAGDCDDADSLVNPDAVEQCNGLDDDCSGAPAGGEVDIDGDGVWACDGDCDDFDDTRAPGLLEQCNGIDDDCDGVLPADERDQDDDAVRVCEGDCDDHDETVSPLLDEVCNGRDDDCDGQLAPDEIDGDGDTISICRGDCDDTDPDIRPGAPETPDDGIDQDCDGEDVVTPAEDTAVEPEDTGDGLGNGTLPRGVDPGEVGGGCGCSTGSVPWSGGFVLLPALVLLRRRRDAR